MSSVTSNSSAESSEEFSRKRTLAAANLSTEEIEPYVRHKRANSSSGDCGKKRAENLSEEEQNLLRTCINSRERRRMHDLNDALDNLRRVMPNSENMRKLSKISTIILATNRLQQMNATMEQLKEENFNLRQQLHLPTEPPARHSLNAISMENSILTKRQRSPSVTTEGNIPSTVSTPQKVPIRGILPGKMQFPPAVPFLPPLVAATLQSMVVMNARNVFQQQQLQQQQQNFANGGLAEIAALSFAQAFRAANLAKAQCVLDTSASKPTDQGDNNNNQQLRSSPAGVCQKCHVFPTANNDNTVSSAGISSCLCVSCILSGRDAIAAGCKNQAADSSPANQSAEKVEN